MTSTFSIYRKRGTSIAATCVLALASLLAIAGAPPAVLGQAVAPKPSERVEGVENFGRVTPLYLRGGAVTPEGIERLKAQGVTTIVDLRDEPGSEEAEVCKRLGIAYYSFPMTGHETPDQATMDRMLSLIRETEAPIYVHCSGGKHRAGTACALYRLKVEGWSPERAWAEQQAYGFGPPEEHPEIFEYVYGGTSVAKRLNSNRVTLESSKIRLPRPLVAVAGVSRDVVSSTARYIAPEDAVRRARTAGGTEDIFRLALEYDDKTSRVLWKVLFSTGVEYRFDALNGEALGTKKKPDTVAVLSSFTLGGKIRSFRTVIRSVEKATKSKVQEIELKRVKGRDLLFYEIALAGGAALYVDATNGKQILEF
jgi:protein tyrosine/serine phosphatase/uncharacterized membrane protein YkoI